jgi:hypothetical protein
MASYIRLEIIMAGLVGLAPLRAQGQFPPKRCKALQARETVLNLVSQSYRQAKGSTL